MKELAGMFPAIIHMNKRKVHLLKWLERIEEWITWCGAISDLELDSQLIEKVNCKDCIKNYRKAIFRENNGF
jgi:hypothetical protein